MKYKFLPHTADVMFEAYGENLEQLFENAALATEATMVELSSLRKTQEHEIYLDSDDIDKLLYDFLSELIFIKDTDGLLFNKFEIIINCKNKKYDLIAKCFGELIDHDKHKLIDDSKAITMHGFEIKKDKGKYKCKVIVDV